MSGPAIITRSWPICVIKISCRALPCKYESLQSNARSSRGNRVNLKKDANYMNEPNNHLFNQYFLA